MINGGNVMRKPIIIDCDPGIDDSIALLMAFASDKLDIRGITPVAGNVGLDKTSINAMKIMEAAGFDCDVSLGASKPLFKDTKDASFVHGQSGLRDIILPEPQKKPTGKAAWDAIYEEAVKCNGELVIVALGPLTNIALTILKYPKIKGLIKEIISMGGSCGLGNDSPAAEFNIYADPDAAQIVFQSGIPLTMVGLDVTHQAVILLDEINEMVSQGKKIDLVEKLFNMTANFCKQFGFKGAVLHDPFAMAYVIDPLVMTTKKFAVEVETKGKITRGKTVVDIYNVTNKEPNIDVGMEVDRERFVALVKELMKKYEV